jgi:hypothetical protein
MEGLYYIRTFFATRTTPRCPEVDQDHFATQTGKLERFAFWRQQGNFRRGGVWWQCCFSFFSETKRVAGKSGYKRNNEKT